MYVQGLNIHGNMCTGRVCVYSIAYIGGRSVHAQVECDTFLFELSSFHDASCKSSWIKIKSNLAIGFSVVVSKKFDLVLIEFSL